MSSRRHTRPAGSGPWILSVFSALLALSSLANSATAATTYVYTGNNFVTVTGLFTTSDLVSLSFTLDTLIAPNLVSSNVSSMIIAFSGSNSVNMLSDEIPLADAGLVVTTDENGAIIEWAAGVVFGDLGSGDHSLSCHVGGSIVTSICLTGGETDSGFDIGGSPNSNTSGRVDGLPGTWAIVLQPVPALSPTGIAFLSGLLGLACVFARSVHGEADPLHPR